MKCAGVVRAVGVSLVSLGALVPAEAQVAQVFVSVEGNDSDPCTTKKPCRTIAGGVAKVGAGGEVVILDSGAFGGATITKAVRVSAPAGVVALARTITVAAGPDDAVVLRGLTVKAAVPIPFPGGQSPRGIQFDSGPSLHIENGVIDGWGQGIAMAGSTRCQQTGSPDFNCKLSISGTVFRNNHVGVESTHTFGRVSVDHSQFEHNENGVHLVAGAATVKDSVFSGHSIVGVGAAGTGEVNVADSLLGGNVEAVTVFAGGTVRVSSCTVTGNAIGLLNLGGTIESWGNNALGGNLSDSQGTITPLLLR